MKPGTSLSTLDKLRMIWIMRITVEKTDSGSKIDLFFSGKRSFCKRQNQEAQCKNPLFNVVFHPSCGHGLLCALAKAKHHETLVKQLQLFELQISTTNLSKHHSFP